MDTQTGNKEACSANEKTPLKKVFSDEELRALILKKIHAIFIPSSVYRIQFNRNFTFKDAQSLVPYFKELGIEALYCSPFFQASPGSLHGYNVTNPNQINEEIGSFEEFSQFADTIMQNGLRLIADVVPNHMGIIGNNNPWWQDILENGQSSIFSDYFDINWKPVKQELAHKILMPVLGNFYGKALENQEIKLNYQKGNFFASYYEHQFQIDPKTYPIILDDSDKSLQKRMGKTNTDYMEFLSIITAFKNLPSSCEENPEKKLERNREKEIAKQRLEQLCNHSKDISRFMNSRILLFKGNKDEPKSFDLLDNLLNLQPYRLAYWSVASQEINYRRFFDINELVALRIEDEKVFRHYHQFLFKLVNENKIHGLRIDHPDGLYDPPVYFKRLQREYLLQIVLKEFYNNSESKNKVEKVDIESVKEALEKLLTNEFNSTPPFYVVVEKILDRNESIPNNWIIHGTVGYDYLNALNGLFVARSNAQRFAEIYEKFIGHSIDYEGLVYDKKKFFGLIHMASEINELGHRLDLISETNRNYRDFTRTDLTVAIREAIAGFPVYRTYVSPEANKISERDEKNIREAIIKARNKTPALNPAVYDFLENALLLRLNIEPGSEEMLHYKDFLLRFQQLSGPIMAKGVEDTSFYVYNRLVSLNEVGGDPFYFGYTSDDFHAHNISRNKNWPRSMITTSTHDTKRSEDVRMRINVLSEIPDEWENNIRQWAEKNKNLKILVNNVYEPKPNTEYFIYQTLIGVWPDNPVSTESMGSFIERIWQYILKSIREAKIYTNWIKPETNYEKAIKMFMNAILTEGESNGFLESFKAFQNKISFLGKLNTLSATVIKIGSPGVVDIYQGNETWNYCLVDPDNRGLVDFKLRKSLFNKLNKNSDPNVFTGDNIENLKFYYTMQGLLFRRRNKDLFIGGEYIPVEVKGPGENNIIAFIRRHGDDIALIVALRLFANLITEKDFKMKSSIWKNTELILSKEISNISNLQNIFNNNVIPVESKNENLIIKTSDLFINTCVCILTNITEKKPLNP